MVIDYSSEQKRISEGGAFWSPKAGTYKVKALTELEETDPFIKKGKDGKPDEVTPKSKIKILVDGKEEKVWTMGRGLTPASLYGQLVDLASKNKNSLINKEFSVVVKFDGTKNDYTIVA